MKNKIENKEDGFTLLELLTVVAIIAILAVIAIPRLSGYRARSVRVSMISDAKNVSTALEAYFTDSGSYGGADGDAATGPNQFAAGTSLAGLRVSKGNTVSIGADGTSFTITITNPAGDGGEYTGPLDVFGYSDCLWASGQHC
jgi:prepilin-type N-terminal cleavage/methylation domain-containing protein